MCVCIYIWNEVTELCPILADAMDCSPPWDFPGKNTGVGCCFLLQGIFPTQGWNPGHQQCRQTPYNLSHQRSHMYIYLCIRMCSVTQLCLILCDSMDCSPPVSSVHGILQARILEWLAMPSSRVSSEPRDQYHISSLQHWQADSLPLSRLGRHRQADIASLLQNCCCCC